MSSSSRPSRIARNSGTALVVTLLLVVLLTIIVTGYVLRASLSSQIATNSTGKGRADQLARTALAVTAGDLREEMRDGSTELANITSPLQRIFIPSSPEKLRPEKVANLGDDQVIKVSRGATPLWTGSAAPNRAIPNYPTDAPSKNRWNISNSSWLKPMLFAGAALPASFTAPDWIPLLRRGPVADSASLPALSALQDHRTNNPDYLVGRYAFIIYDLGGRLNINAAGSPLTGNDVKRRGRVALADLNQIPGLTDPAAFLAWRSAATGALTDTTSGSGSIFDPQRSFLSVPPVETAGKTDNTLLSRQELLAYQQANPDQIQTSALPFLTTFSREKNAPSFTRDTPSSVNPSLLSVRWTQDRDLPDGTRVKRGTPVVFRRFPLSRLASITDAAIAVSNDESDEIYRWFGLTRSDASQPWIYNHGVTDRILNLAEVEALGREPDFFELLQAVIEAGSLGKEASNESIALTRVFDRNETLQVLQIGANLVDQADADSFPTWIQTTNSENAQLYDLFGIEDLPYPLAFHTTYFRPQGGVLGNNSSRDDIHLWLMVEVWNPHQISPASYTGPTSLRASAVSGSMRAATAWQNSGGGGINQTFGAAKDFQLSPANLVFAYAGNSFREPALLGPSNITSTSPDAFTEGSASFAGFYVGFANAPDRRLTGNPLDKNYTHSSSSFIGLPVTIELQYLHPNHGWRAYSRVEGISNTGVGTLMWAATGGANNPGPNPYINIGSNGLPSFITNSMIRSEPRSSRFGLFSGAKDFGMTIRPSRASSGIQSNYGTPAEPSFDHDEPAATWNPKPQFGRPGMWSDNNSSSTIIPNSSYSDPDGHIRPADGFFGAFPHAQGSDLDLESRPLVVNRPFRNVAELGYIFRDQPFKSLDFFSDMSADLNLLDVFSVDDAEMTAGKTDINSAPAEVLTSLLSGAGWREQNNSAQISATSARDIADRIVAKRDAANPIQNPAQLETWLVKNVLDDVLTGDNLRIKEQREAVIRSLSSSIQTRTWNVMIDIVAQSGHLAPNADTISDFVVDGEVRYWLHLAIDRFTGEILDQEMESVTN